MTERSSLVEHLLIGLPHIEQKLAAGDWVKRSNEDGEPGASLEDFFDSLFGSLGGRGAGRRSRVDPFGGFEQQTRAQGRDIEQPITITLREAYEGATRYVTKGGRRLKVTVPAGATNGTKVRLSGEGEAGAGGGPTGDLYLVVEVQPDNQFERKGDDLYTDVRVDMFTAMLGGEVEVPTLSRPVKLKIPAGTQSGRKFRVSGRGMPVLRQSGQYGDLYARILITVPESLTPQQRELVEKLRASLSGK